MTIRMTIGMIVQAISINVLCVVREGTGLARALKRTITITSKASTKAVMAVMM
jgi:hypothetical protein